MIGRSGIMDTFIREAELCVNIISYKLYLCLSMFYITVLIFQDDRSITCQTDIS